MTTNLRSVRLPQRLHAKQLLSVHVHGSNRLRIWGYGGPEYSQDFPYASDNWTFREYVIYCDRTGGGGVSLWVWPRGHCDIDNLIIRPSFWRTEKAIYTAGETIVFDFRMPATHPVTGEFVLTMSGRELARGSLIRSSAGVLTHQQRARAAVPGYYRLVSTVRSNGEFHDTLAVPVISELDGEAALAKMWAEK